MITLNRPQNRNAVNKFLAAELYEVFGEFDRDDTIKIAILTGKITIKRKNVNSYFFDLGSGDDAFCAGFDLKAFSSST